MSRFRISVISVLSTVGHFQIYEVPPSRRGAGRRKKFREGGPSIYPYNIYKFERNRRGSTWEVIQKNRTSLTQRLLKAVPLCWHFVEAGAAVNCETARGETALLVACKGSSDNAVELLLQRGADVEKADKDQLRPILVGWWPQLDPYV